MIRLYEGEYETYTELGHETVEFGDKLGTSPCKQCSYWLNEFYKF